MLLCKIENKNLALYFNIMFNHKSYCKQEYFFAFIKK